MQKEKPLFYNKEYCIYFSDFSPCNMTECLFFPTDVETKAQMNSMIQINYYSNKRQCELGFVTFSSETLSFVFYLFTSLPISLKSGYFVVFFLLLRVGCSFMSLFSLKACTVILLSELITSAFKFVFAISFTCIIYPSNIHLCYITII